MIAALALLVLLVAGCGRDRSAVEPGADAGQRGAGPLDLTAFPDTQVIKLSERQWTVDLLPEWDFFDFDRARLSPSGRQLAISGNGLLGDEVRTVIEVVALPPDRGFRVVVTTPAILAVALGGEPPTEVPETGYTGPGRWSDALVVFDLEGRLVSRREIAGWRVSGWAWAWDSSGIAASATRPIPDPPPYAADDLTYGDVYFFPVSGRARRLWENSEQKRVSVGKPVDGSVLIQVPRAVDRWETLLLALDGSGPLGMPEDWQDARFGSLPFGMVAMTAEGDVNLWTRGRGAVRIGRVGSLAGHATAFGGYLIVPTLRTDQAGALEVIDVQGLVP